MYGAPIYATAPYKTSRGEFQNLIASTQPDIVVAAGTWLTEGQHHYGEIGEVDNFSTAYKIYRRTEKIDMGKY